ncbi:hypothetical protein OIDMADRAFT_53383 [Oidiodendron maius Zn]|uniref:SUZ domain-containing protein n=1 Tax=Oidiodendron maius (strain Zn) TaxID=913774 RepID=A0A0C3DIM9_OIDMZ|nr:hypothetical protein OIDMADRAFT_53383 [Oidiodendron maius Zn]
MSKKFAIPDAWDDDWEAQADKTDAAAEPAKAEKEVKISKAERLAQHAETNKKIWESAEAPETFHFLAARDNVPFKQEFKPAMKVLSRKPVVQKIDPATGLAKLALDDGEDEGDEERKINQPTPEELRLKAQREREEKQRRYDEARARILGTPSGRSTPGSITPPTEEGKESRGKGRGRKVDRQDIRRPDNQGAHWRFGTSTSSNKRRGAAYSIS